MGKKRRAPDIEEVLSRPWCYYCERDFDDLKILISHQKAKHFKCDRCGRRLNTAGGLAVHLNQVHKETLSTVDNALPNRQSLDVEIFGMEGVPDDVRQQHDQRVTQQYWEEQAERRAITGNPTPGDANSSNMKKVKLAEPSDMKSRLAAFKAKKASGELASSGGSGTLVEAVSGSPVTVPISGSPVYPLPGAQASPPIPVMNPYTPFQPAPTFIQPGYGAPPGYPPQLPFQGTPPFPQAPYAPPGTMPMNGQFQPSIPVPTGLPQRPIFGTPQIDATQFHQMHQGQTLAAPEANRSPVNATSVDDLISNAAKTASAAATPAPTDKKAAKKDKNRPARLLYADNDLSPEVKKAHLQRYAFTPDRKGGTAVV